MGHVENIGLKLTPHWNGNSVSNVDVVFVVKTPDFKADEAMCTKMESTVNIPFCPVEGNPVFRDDKGIVSFESAEDAATQSFVKTRSYRALRDTTGDLTYSYRILPRVVPEDYTSSPYFDFRAEPGGANGAGLTFLMPPARDDEAEVEFSLEWDLSDMPEGSGGVWSFGRGSINRRTRIREIKFSYYAAGLLESEEENDFGIYWFGDPPFEMAEVAKRTRSLFGSMADFFGDKDSTYRIFVRKDPFEKSGGGTAATRSFMFGYSDKTFPTVDSMQNLLAHEMVHNWPHISDEPAGRGTWYNEGCAEYYSVVLPYRAGLSTLEDVCKQIEQRAEKYYANPTRNMSNAELAQHYWDDRRTQIVPYGRGFFYIANTDAAIRRATSNRKSVDDIVLEIARVFAEAGGAFGSEGEPDEELWLRLVTGILGSKAAEAFDAMISGELIIPDPDAFGGAFEVVPGTVILTDTDEEAAGFAWSISEGKTDANTTM